MDQLSYRPPGAYRQEQGKKYMGICRKHSDRSLVVPEKALAPCSFLSFLSSPHETVTVCIGEGRWEEQKEECGQQAES